MALQKKLAPYVRKVRYYETDQMGVIHHANYIRWFEEARLEFLEQLGLDYQKLEELGIISPVLGISCKYKSAVKFGDTVTVELFLTFFNGLRMNITYQICDKKTGKIRATGQSKHCFLMKETKRPIQLQKNHPAIYKILAAQVLNPRNSAT